MANPTTVLGNLLSHFPRSEFEKAVQELGGDKRVRSFSCFDMVLKFDFCGNIRKISCREPPSARTGD